MLSLKFLALSSLFQDSLTSMWNLEDVQDSSTESSRMGSSLISLIILVDDNKPFLNFFSRSDFIMAFRSYSPGFVWVGWGGWVGFCQD